MIYKCNICIFSELIEKQACGERFLTSFSSERKSCINRIGGVMVSVLASSVLERWFDSNQRLYNWYMLLLRYARSIEEKEQRLVGSESG
jgi:hypothetical protein